MIYRIHRKVHFWSHINLTLLWIEGKKMKLSLCLIKYHTMTMYGGEEV
jgi:hypothetical protein